MSGKRFYVASSLSNIVKVRAIQEALTAHGLACTFYWDLVPVSEYGPRSALELTAVQLAELFIAVLPGKFGTQAEIGIALAERARNPNRRVLLYAESEEVFTRCSADGQFYPNVFWHHPLAERVCGENPVSTILSYLGLYTMSTNV